MIYHDYPYCDALEHILREGQEVEDRTGTGTISAFGLHMWFELDEGFPLLTTKRVHFRAVAEELFWFMRGDTNTRTLNASIWDEWADQFGELGPIYGRQWRSWDGKVDQLQNVLYSLRDDPTSRRHIVSAWNVTDLDKMALPPCHLLFQFYVRGGQLDCQIYQRSCDMFLGVPFNIASYALLTHIMAYMTDLSPGTLSWVGGDCHVYKNHLPQVRTVMSRTARQSPKLWLDPKGDRTLDNWEFGDIQLEGYNPHGKLPGKVSV